MTEKTPEILGLTVGPPPIEAVHEPRKLPEGVVLTFAVEPATGIMLSDLKEGSRGIQHYDTDVEYFADGRHVGRDDYNAIIQTIAVSERLGMSDELNARIADLVKRYEQHLEPKESDDAPSEA